MLTSQIFSSTCVYFIFPSSLLLICINYEASPLPGQYFIDWPGAWIRTLHRFKHFRATETETWIFSHTLHFIGSIFTILLLDFYFICHSNYKVGLFALSNTKCSCHYMLKEQFTPNSSTYFPLTFRYFGDISCRDFCLLSNIMGLNVVLTATKKYIWKTQQLFYYYLIYLIYFLIITVSPSPPSCF